MYEFARSYLHFYKKRIAHRDLKPANVILTKDRKIKFIDLACCQRVDANTGTPAYMPPQVYANRWDLQDIWAYGTICYEIAFKKWPDENDLVFPF